MSQYDASDAGRSPASQAPIPTDLQTIDAIATTLIQYEPVAGEALVAAAASSPKNGKSQQLREILDAMLPPRVVDGVAQHVSMRAVGREDVIKLQIALDGRLQLRQARETGLCPVREQLYAQTFDELIRQVTIECPERGLLLLRIRDESKMTIAAYQTLYESSVVFGIRKSLQAEVGTESLAETIAAAEARKAALKAELERLRTRLETIEKQDSERRAIVEKKRHEEKEFVKFQRQHLESFLKQTVG